MQAADTPQVEAAIQRALANESATELNITSFPSTPLTVNDAQCIIACLENPRFDTLRISNYSLHDDAVLDVFRDGLPMCTSVARVTLEWSKLGNEGLQRLLPAFCNTSVRSLTLRENGIQRQRSGEVLRDLLVGNDTIVELILFGNRHFGPEGAIGLGQGLAGNNRLQILHLQRCDIDNEDLANLSLSMGGETNYNNSLMVLHLDSNRIEGADGGRQVTLLLKRFPKLKVLRLNFNNLGPLGARALAPGLATACHLESLELFRCGLGNDGVANLIPQGQVNKSLTRLDLQENDIEGTGGGRQAGLLLQRFPSLKVLKLNHNMLGDLGACALAPGVAAASHLESLGLEMCRLGNDGVASIIPEGQVNRSLINLNVRWNNVVGDVGGENFIALASRCTNLDSLTLDELDERILSPDQERRLNLVLDRKRLCTSAKALGGSPLSALFRFVEEAHRHEHGLSAIFVILQNDGDDYFCTALNRAIE